jgi:hypothetical protein
MVREVIMPLGPQPKGARGTVERPYSALRLRLVLAIFGFVVCIAGAIVLWHRTMPIAIALFVVAATALVDMGIILTRLSRR